MRHSLAFASLCVLSSGCFDLRPDEYLFTLDSGVRDAGATAMECDRQCLTPPLARCLDETSLEAFPTHGRCSPNSGCGYIPVHVTCANRCVAGECVDEPCAGVICDAPPPTRCEDSSHARVFAALGTCSTAGCQYPGRLIECPGGCAGDVCAGADACETLSCSAPPETRCDDARTLSVFAQPGVCTSGSCTYLRVTLACAKGCSDGGCVDEPCAGVTCNQPPAPSCLSPTRARSFTATGLCMGGACRYLNTDVICAENTRCVGGECVSAVDAGDSVDGGHPSDGGRADAGATSDAGSASDAGQPSDSGVPRDGGSSIGFQPLDGGGLCSPDGWCWQNPTPIGEGMNRVWASGSGDLWLFGNGQSLRYDGVGWSVRSAPALARIWGTGENDVWGITTRDVWHWDGATWSSVRHSSSDLTRIWGRSSTDVWVLGSTLFPQFSLEVLHWDGSSWQSRPFSGGGLSLWTAIGGNDERVLVSSGTDLVAWSNGSWVAVPTGNSETVGKIAGNGANASLFSTQGSVFSWSGTAWVRQNPNPGLGIDSFRFWGDRVDDIWAPSVDTAGLLHRWDGASWSSIAVADAGIADLFSVGRNDAWLVENRGAVRHWDGGSWSASALPRVAATRDHLKAVWGTSRTDVWAAGAATTDGGIAPLVHFDGTSWAPFDSATSEQLLAGWSRSPDEAWAVGTHGLVLHWSSTAWAPVATFTASTLRTVWGSGAQDVWAAGDDGTLAHYNGVSWSKQTTDQGAVLHLSGTSASSAWAVTTTGAVLSWNGSTWAKTGSGGPRPFAPPAFRRRRSGSLKTSARPTTTSGFGTGATGRWRSKHPRAGIWPWGAAASAMFSQSARAG